MDEKLKNKTAVISGGGSGIGKAAALKFASEGASVIIADINEEEGKSTLKLLQEKSPLSSFVRCDVSNADDVKRVFSHIEKQYGKLDVIYNNASVYLSGRDGRVTDIDEEVWDKVISINLRSVFLFCKYGIPLLISNGGGTVINTASSAGIIGIPDCDAYTASKGGTVQLTKSMASEYGQCNVRINCIAPAAIMTDMMRKSNPENSTFDEEHFLKLRAPLRRYGTAEEIANIACFLASDEASYLNGAIIAADGGITINGDLSKIK